MSSLSRLRQLVREPIHVSDSMMKSGMYVAVIKIGAEKFHSYPEFCWSAVDAQEKAAAKAVEFLTREQSGGT